MLAVLEQVEKVAEKSPGRAPRGAGGREDPVTLTTAPEGYEVSLTLRNETAALAGGRSLFSDGCGGPMDQFSPTEKALYTRRINPCGACSFPSCDRPLHGAGLCDGHRNQVRRGVPLTPLRPPRRKPKADAA